VLIRRPLLSDVLRFGKNQVADQVGPSALPFEQGQGGAARLFHGIKSLSTANHYASAADAQPRGATTLTEAVLFRLDGLPAADEILCGHGPVSGAAGGHNIWIANAGDSARLSIVDGAGAIKTSPTSAFAAGDVGKVFLITGVYNNTDVRLYRQGALVGAGGTASTGYAATDVDVKSALGCGYTATGAATFGAPDVTIIGWAVSQSTALSAAQVLEHYNSCVAAKDMALFPAGTEYRWRVSQNKTVAASFVDDVGGISLALAGTPVYEAFAGTWG